MARFLFYDERIINLMLQEEKPAGGSAVQTYGWIRGLMEEGQEVFVMTETDGRGLIKEECANINLVPTFTRNRGIRWVRWIYYRMPFIYKKIRAVKPDYLYLSIPGWTSFVMAMICRRLKIKLIQRISNDNLLDKRYHKDYSSVHQFFLFLGLKYAHHILCQNNLQLMLIRKRLPGKPALKISNPLYLHSNGTVSAFGQRGYIAWLGIFRLPKNIKLLFQVASLLRNEQFLIAGKEGTNCDAETRDYVEKLRHLPNVKFTGFLTRTEILPFLSNARFLLNTSIYEGFSNTFLEALSVGTPVISGVNVNPDSIISKYSLGIIYEDVFDLCRQYAGVTPELYQLMADNARQYVSNNHGYRILSGRLLRYLSGTDKIDVGGENSQPPIADQTIQKYFQEHGAE